MLFRSTAVEVRRRDVRVGWKRVESETLGPVNFPYLLKARGSWESRRQHPRERQVFELEGHGVLKVGPGRRRRFCGDSSTFRGVCFLLPAATLCSDGLAQLRRHRVGIARRVRYVAVRVVGDSRSETETKPLDIFSFGSVLQVRRRRASTHPPTTPSPASLAARPRLLQATLRSVPHTPL